MKINLTPLASRCALTLEAVLFSVLVSDPASHAGNAGSNPSLSGYTDFGVCAQLETHLRSLETLEITAVWFSGERS